MAENEVLDVRWGRRWAATRALLNQPGIDPATLAESVCSDAYRDVQRSIKRALQNGSTLVSIFQVADGNAAAMRAAVSVFPDQQLARFTREGCLLSPTKSPHDTARTIANLMFDAFAQRTEVFSGRYEDWRALERRKELRAELEQRREFCVAAITETLERSLRGEAIRIARRPAKSRVTAEELVRKSLNIRPLVNSNRHGQ